MQLRYMRPGRVEGNEASMALSICFNFVCVDVCVCVCVVHTDLHVMV